jgi:putative ABC transport system permease protein
VKGDGKALAAFDPAVIAKLVDFKVTAGDIADLGDGVAVNVDPARDLKLNIGDTVDLLWQNGKSTTLPVKAIFDDSSVLNANWMVSLATLDARSDTVQPRDQFVAAKLKNGADPNAARAAIDKLTATYPEVRIEDQGQFRKRQLKQIDQLQFIIFGMLLLSVIIALFGIINTLALSVFERTRELGLLRAVGMGRRQLRRIIRWEAVVVAVFGGLLGIVIGTPLGAAISSAMPKSFISTVAIPWSTLAIMLVLAMVAGLLAAVLPAWRAGRMNVLAAIASE